MEEKDKLMNEHERNNRKLDELMHKTRMLEKQRNELEYERENLENEVGNFQNTNDEVYFIKILHI